MILIRTFEPKDYDMVCEWFAGHKNTGKRKFPSRAVLSPIGQIAYDSKEEVDLVAVWLYMAQGTPVCFMEHGISKPGLHGRTVTLAFITLLGCMRKLAESLGYKVMITHCSPRLARICKKHGWHQDNADVTTLSISCETAAA